MVKDESFRVIVQWIHLSEFVHTYMYFLLGDFQCSVGEKSINDTNKTNKILNLDVMFEVGFAKVFVLVFFKKNIILH